MVLDTGGYMRYQLRVWFVLWGLLLTCGCEDTVANKEPETESGDVTKRNFTYRAITGVSMGGSGAAQLALYRPELFDYIGALGSPLISLKSFGRILRRSWLRGFCSLELLEEMHAAGVDLNSEAAFCGIHSPTPVGNLEPEFTQVPTEWLTNPEDMIYEFPSDFNHWYRGHEGGRGASYFRAGLIKTFFDLFKAYGNPFYEGNDQVPWAAPGITREWEKLSKAEKCAQPVVLDKFYNAEYNPTGSYPVISFCDGEHRDVEGTQESFHARLLPETPRSIPFYLLLAVDINRNGVRDYGEPVIHNSAERYVDYGVDGLADTEEPGYDSILNPDPAGDNYNPISNATGTERNYARDEGEAYTDYGLDGVPNTHDYGENNNQFDWSPGWERARQFDPHSLLEALSADQLNNLDVYVDAGIRDFMNSAINSNAFFGALCSKTSSELCVEYEGFSELGFDLTAIDPSGFIPEAANKFTYVRYGSVDASLSDIHAGDGNHVGKINQVVSRVIGAFTVIQDLWPNPKREVRDNPFGKEPYVGVGKYRSETLHMEQEYSYVLPPGYHEPELADERYPVMFFLHGQGMKHSMLKAAAFAFHSLMAEEYQGNETPWTKFIIILPDGNCKQGVCGSGNFWTDFSTGEESHRYRQDFYELLEHVDRDFRTLSGSPVDSTVAHGGLTRVGSVE